jgi:hypothetical protein
MEDGGHRQGRLHHVLSSRRTALYNEISPFRGKNETPFHLSTHRRDAGAIERDLKV